MGGQVTGRKALASSYDVAVELVNKKYSRRNPCLLKQFLMRKISDGKEILPFIQLPSRTCSSHGPCGAAHL